MRGKKNTRPNYCPEYQYKGARGGCGVQRTVYPLAIVDTGYAAYVVGKEGGGT